MVRRSSIGQLRAHRPHPGPRPDRDRRPARPGLHDRDPADLPARGGCTTSRPSRSCRTSFSQPVLTGEDHGPGGSPGSSTPSDWSTGTSASTRQARPRCSGRCGRFPRTSRHRSIPRSPYGVAKVYGHWITGQLPRVPTGSTPPPGSSSTTRARAGAMEFVTRKITHAAASIKLGLAGRVAARQPGIAAGTGATPPDYVEGHVADGAAGRARRLRDLHRQDALVCAPCANWPSNMWGWTTRDHVVVDERFIRPARGRPARRRLVQGPWLRSAGSRRRRSWSWCG